MRRILCRHCHIFLWTLKSVRLLIYLQTMLCMAIVHFVLKKRPEKWLIGGLITNIVLQSGGRSDERENIQMCWTDNGVNGGWFKKK